MGDIKFTDRFLKRIDNIEEPDGIDPYTPSKAKSVIVDELFTDDKDREPTLFDDESRINDRTKIIAIVLIAVSFVTGLTFGISALYKPIANIYYSSVTHKTVQTLIKNGALLNISDIALTNEVKGTLEVDSDGDGIPNAVEIEIGSNPNSKDTDIDGIPDSLEYNNKKLNIIGYGDKEKQADIKYFKSHFDATLINTAYPKNINTYDLARELGIEQKYIVVAFKVYQPATPKLDINEKGIKAVLEYVPQYNEFRAIKYKKTGKGVQIGIKNSGVVIGFNIGAKEVFKRISYRQMSSNIITAKYYRDTKGLIDYDAIYEGVDFKNRFSINRNTLTIPTIWSTSDGANNAGMGWFTGALYNGAQINNYNELEKLYGSHKFIEHSPYMYSLSDVDLSDISKIKFKDQALTADILNGRQQIAVDKLPRPDKEIAGAITQLNSIALDTAIEKIMLKDGSSDTLNLDKIVDEIHDGNTVLSVMGNRNSIHAVLIYGMVQSGIDEDIYNFAVYDSNINYNGNNKLQILQAEASKYAEQINQGEKYISYKYGIGSEYYWDTRNNDIFIFYKINKDLTLECIE